MVDDWPVSQSVSQSVSHLSPRPCSVPVSEVRDPLLLLRYWPVVDTDIESCEQHRRGGGHAGRVGRERGSGETVVERMKNK